MVARQRFTVLRPHPAGDGEPSEKASSFMFSVSRLKNAALEGFEKLFPTAPASPTAPPPDFNPAETHPPCRTS